jgi:nucleotide-binding universal stress UspA family protein
VIPLETILCAVDQSEYSRSTLQRAIDLGKALHAAVAVMTVRTGAKENESQRSSDPDAIVDQALGAEKDRAVARLAAFAREAAGVTPVRAIAARGRVVPAILRVAHDVAADLIVVGMHGPPGGFAGLLLSPITERLVGKATCPVLAVPRRAPSQAADVPLRTIVCGADRSASSRRALEFALVVAQQVGARVIVVHAIEDVADEDLSITAGHFNTPECRREIASQVHASYEQMMPADIRLTDNVEVQTTVGAAHAELLRVAKEAGADLIVMGATGWRGSFGKTVRHVLREANCDVMAVPAPSMSAS